MERSRVLVYFYLLFFHEGNPYAILPLMKQTLLRLHYIVTSMPDNFINNKNVGKGLNPIERKTLQLGLSQGMKAFKKDFIESCKEGSGRRSCDDYINHLFCKYKKLADTVVVRQQLTADARDYLRKLVDTRRMDSNLMKTAGFSKKNMGADVFDGMNKIVGSAESYFHNMMRTMLGSFANLHRVCRDAIQAQANKLPASSKQRVMKEAMIITKRIQKHAKVVTKFAKKYNTSMRRGGDGNEERGAVGVTDVTIEHKDECDPNASNPEQAIMRCIVSVVTGQLPQDQQEVQPNPPERVETPVGNSEKKDDLPPSGSVITALTLGVGIMAQSLPFMALGLLLAGRMLKGVHDQSKAKVALEDDINNSIIDNMLYCFTYFYASRDPHIAFEVLRNICHLLNEPESGLDLKTIASQLNVTLENTPTTNNNESEMREKITNFALEMYKNIEQFVKLVASYRLTRIIPGTQDAELTTVLSDCVLMNHLYDNVIKQQGIWYVEDIVKSLIIVNRLQIDTETDVQNKIMSKIKNKELLLLHEILEMNYPYTEIVMSTIMQYAKKETVINEQAVSEK